MAAAAIPIRPVENPILCSPYKEPDQHWLYDTRTGLPQKIPHRREASYWYRTERTGSRQLQLLAEEERDDLPLVNALRRDVKAWREAGYRNASQTTKRLLRHWWREDRARRLFFCQLEAVETIIYLEEILSTGQRTRARPRLTTQDFHTLREGHNPRPNEWVAKVAQHPKLADLPPESWGLPIPRYACKMATGAGKTVVMAMLVAWAFCNRAATPGNPRFPRRVLVVCPNLTIKERLNVLHPGAADNYYQRFDIVPSSLRPELAKGKVLVTNWHWFNPAPEVVTAGGMVVSRLGEETDEAFARKRLGDLFEDEPLMVLNDEGHHAWRPRDGNGKLSAEEATERQTATVWIDGLDRLNAACGIGICVDLSATPFYLHGSGYPEGSPFPWIVSDFGLVDAIESGITKIPRLPASDNSGRPDPVYFRLWDNILANLRPGDRLPGGKPKPQAAYREAEPALLTLAGEWKERFDLMQAATPDQERSPPVMILVCDNTDLAAHFHKMIAGEIVRGQSANGLVGFPALWNSEPRDVTLRIDSKLLAAAESQDGTGTVKAAAEELRKVVSTIGVAGEPGEHIRCVVSVNMLSEGWDANNVTQILGLRAFRSQLLCEQVVGRGLRRMDYTPDPETGFLTAEYVDVFGVPFSLIPFKGREKGRSTGKADRPKQEVMAVPERQNLEIRFPVVEGYAASSTSNRIVCDVDELERTTLDPADTPTATFIRPQVAHQVGHVSAYGGFELVEVNRSEYHQSTHLQTVEFAIAARLVGELTETANSDKQPLHRQSRQALFPQVLRIVHDYIDRRVAFNGMHRCDVGLQTYAERIVNLLAAAIVPVESSGAPALLPRLNPYRPLGSTADVHFKTVKPVRAATASHLNAVACDTGSWEQAAMFQIERLAAQGLVRCYVRNEQLDFNIPYEFHDVSHAYEPDFIVELKSGLKVVVEVKGRSHPETPIKHEAAKRWAAAVTHWGELGHWQFLVCWDPQRLGDELGRVAAEHKARMQPLVKRIRDGAKAEADRLRAIGWTKRDFANALGDLLDVPRSSTD